jgi:putative flippase GtrA
MTIRPAVRGNRVPVLEQPGSAARIRPGLVTRLARCVGVSVVTTMISVSALTIATMGLGVKAWFANVLATSIATVPSYRLNRQWTWCKHGESDPWREVLPFWALAFAGLALSTVFVALTDPWMTHLHTDPAMHMGAVIGAHLSGFGVLWAVQFVLLDRVLFRSS